MGEYKMCANAKMAIDIIAFIERNYEKHSDQAGVQKYIEALQMSKEALEKQIVKKPLYIAGDYDLPICSECKNVVEDNEPYCSVCGQALDWSDAECVGNTNS